LHRLLTSLIIITFFCIFFLLSTSWPIWTP